MEALETTCWDITIIGLENGRKICHIVNDVGESRSKLWVRGVATTGCGVAKWGVA